jgi:WD40 repeat protein
MDHLDQVATCYSCTFNADGRLVVAGSNKSIHVFDSSIPGRSIVDVAVKTTEAPVSSLSFRRDDTGVLAAGSFAGHIGVYDIRIGADPSQVMLLAGHSEGVTQVLFDGWNVYSVARKEDQIWQWDLRTSSVVKHFGPRNSTTNQRLYFSLCGTRLVTGDQDGNLITFETSSGEAGSVEPTTITRVANTVTSSATASVHHPDLVAITAGERFFHVEGDASSDDEIPPESSHLGLFRVQM